MILQPGGIRRIFTAILFIVLFHFAGRAQVNHLRFSHLGIAEGLSQSSVYSLFQDSRGFIWVATTDGLNRYDGYGFRHFRYDPTNPYSIISNELLTLEEDSRGNLLVGTAFGLDLFDCRQERFQRVLPVLKGADYVFRHVNAIKKDGQGNIWIGTARGLMLYDEKAKALRPVDLGKGAGAPYVRTIAVDPEGVLWLAGGKEVLCYNPASRRVLPAPEALLQNERYGKSTFQQVNIDSAGNVWLGTEKDGLIVWDRKTRRCSNFNSETPVKIGSDMVRAIYFQQNEAWIGTRNGLYILNNERTAVRNYVVDKYDPYSISGNSILCIMKDRAGSMWVGSFAGGISVEHPGNENFSYINEQMGRQPGLTYRVVSSIREDKNQNLWIATEGGGVNFYDRGSNTFRHIRINPGSPHHINPEMVKAIHLDGRGNLLIGTLEGLFKHNIKSGGIQSIPLKESPARVMDDVVYGLAGDADNLWVGTKGGLFHINGSGEVTRFRKKNDPASIISNDINALILDSEGGVWIGTEIGLSWLPKGKQAFRNYLAEYDSVFNKNAILCIYEDDRRNIWIGTRGGGLKLLNRERNQFFTLDTAFGLSSNIVHGIIQDQKGDLWVSFDQSIARIVLRKAHAPFAQEDVQVVNYSVNNGLGSNEFLAAACRTAAGEVMFGGNNGIVSFNPEKLIINRTKPPVALTSFLIKNRPVAIGGEDSPLRQSITYTDHITLKHNQAYFTVGFAALNYINSGTNQYAYTLEGMKGDTQWSYVGSQQQATYTNLDAGEYVFKVKAANNDGLWNETYTSLRITVLPPIWKTWYAYLFYTITIAAILYFLWAHSLKTARLRHELQMQQRSREKDRELAQRKLSFFTNISHEIKTPLTLILAPLEKLVKEEQGNHKVLNQLLLIQRNGERLMRLTDQLLDFRKFEAGHLQLQVAQYDMVQFLREVLLSFDAYARQRNLKLDMETEAPEMPLWFDHDKLEKILFNLLSNAVKFTPPGGSIRVCLRTNEERQVVISVEDNGAGIAPQHLGKIFNPFHHYNDTGLPISGTGIGLAFTKGLVGLHRGQITVESVQSVGGKPGHTCFTVSLPLYREQYAESEILQPAAATPPVEELPVPQREEDGGGDQPVMLIVEDNAEMLAFIASHFREQYTVHEAADGKEGWKIATDVLPDIIISDVAMPGMSGTDLCRKLKKDERTSHIPVILLTARSPLVFQMEGLETGADDYVTKPFNMGLLQLRVGNLLQSRALLRERYSKDIMLQPRNISITSAEEVFLDKVMHFIDENILEPTLNVEQLAREVNMSRITLYRKIKALTNQSTIEFIRSYRLKRAAQYLERNEFTVTEVAYMVGFSDVDYFRKWFKTEFGRTPKEYAAAHAGNAGE